MFRFASPAYLLLAVAAVAAAWRVYRRGRRAGVLFAATHRIPDRRGTWRTRLAAVLPAVTLAGLALMIGALARPQTVLSRSRRTADAIAIQMVVDVSGSMEALDLSTGGPGGTVKYRTRLDAVKEAFAEFVRRRPDDLIGLISFGGFAATRAPLTADHAALLHILSGVEIPRQSVDKSGQIANREELLTAVGDALATACARLEPADLKTRIVVLLSDGESNTGVIKPEDAARIAARMGIRIYTIGVGTTGRAPFRARDLFGREAVQYAQVTLDEDLLKALARDTGGQYFNVRDPRGLEKALQQIDTLEKTRVERDVYSQYRELYGWLLWPALGLVAAGAGLNVLVARRIV